MFKKIILISFAFISLNVFAQNASSLLIDSNPRDIAAVKLNSDVALLSFSPNTFSVNANYSMWAPKSINNQIIGANAYLKIGEKFTLGLKGKMISDKVQLNPTTSSGSTARKDETVGKDLDIHLYAAFRPINNLSIGIAAKYYSSVLSSELKASAIAADISAAYSVGGLLASISVRNLGTPLKFGSQTSSLPTSARLAGEYLVTQGLKINADAEYLFAGAFMAGAGAEYSIKDIVFVRAGYHYGNSSRALPSFAAVGLGLKFVGIELCASYLLANSTLQNTLLFGLGYSF